MTWNELIYRVQQIPEDRREEQAVFFREDEGEGWIVDEMEKIDLAETEASFDCTVGDDVLGTTYVLIP